MNPEEVKDLNHAFAMLSALESDDLDFDKLTSLRGAYHEELPAPYSVAVYELNFADRETYTILSAAVALDDSLSREEKCALQNELFDRNRTAHMVKAPDVWND